MAEFMRQHGAELTQVQRIDQAQADFQVLARQFVPGGTTGTLDFALPPTPGRYEFRYFATGGSTHAAASNVMTSLPAPACAVSSK